MNISHKIISRGILVVFVDDKSLDISGELTFYPPVFYADMIAIDYWNAPHQNQKITDQEKQEIISYLMDCNDATKIIID